MVTPPGWVRLDIHVEPLLTPRQFRNVSTNLFRMMDERHGVHRFQAGETDREEHGSPMSPAGTDMGQAIDSFIDCKETPGSGCNSVDHLRIIREGKRPSVDIAELSNLRRVWDSGDWYSFCSDDGGCTHIGGSHGTRVATTAIGEDWVVTHVWVARPHLGLSPTIESVNMLLGEVLREFVHIIIGDTMCKVDFGGVIGVRAIKKHDCEPAAEEDIFAASTQALEGNNNVRQEPTQASTFTLDLPTYLDVVGDESSDEAEDPNWEADFVDWRGNSDSGNSDWVRSDSGSEPEVV